MTTQRTIRERCTPRADYHIHTLASDGEDRIAELIEKVREWHMLDIMATTDHDTCAAAQYAYGYMRHVHENDPDNRLQVVPGVEITARASLNGTLHICHILGLGIDPFDEELLNICHYSRLTRQMEVESKLQHISDKGYGLSITRAAELFENPYTGRGEIARALIAEKRFDDVDTAYHAVFDDYSEAPTAEEFFPAAEVIDAIHGAGGLAVWAHPIRDELKRGRISRAAAQTLLLDLKAVGIDAIECYYSAFSYDDCSYLEKLAVAHGLYVSGGSDHHGGINRSRLGRICADGGDYYDRLTIAEALSLKEG